MTSTWILVTTRREKAEEARRLGFSVEQKALELPEEQDLDPVRIVDAKARAAFSRLSRPVLVEDSGLAISAWAGFPGALVKWMEQSVGLDGIAKMLDPFSERRATAICAVACFDGRAMVRARGEVEGEIAAAPRGSGGFGWDRLFVPAGESRTFAEMAPEEKDRVSHRRRAWEALALRLPGLRAEAGTSPREI